MGYIRGIRKAKAATIPAREFFTSTTVMGDSIYVLAVLNKAPSSPFPN